jgi:hypothetical protein
VASRQAQRRGREGESGETVSACGLFLFFIFLIYFFIIIIFFKAEAYEILSDEEKRKAYDRGEEVLPNQGGGGQQGNPFAQHFRLSEIIFIYQIFFIYLFQTRWTDFSFPVWIVS